jgi:putative membrane protein
MVAKFQLLFWTLVFPLSALVFTGNSHAQWRDYGWHDGPGMMGGWGMGWFGPIFMIAFWALVITALVLFIRWLVQQGSKRGSDNHRSSSAIEILKERYARGEIDREEFDQKKQHLLE